MPDFSKLNQAITDLTTQVSSTETVEGSAVTLINGFSAQISTAVTTALAADDAADQGSIDAANAAISQVTQRFNASAAALGTAVTANTPQAPPASAPKA